MSRTIDPHRPRSLNDQQLSEVNWHTEVILQRRVRDRLAKGARARHTTVKRSKGTQAYEAFKQAKREYLRTKRAVHKATLKQIKARYREERPIEDILCQLRDEACQVPEQVPTAQAENVLSRERQRVLAALLTFAPTEPTDAQARRMEAIAAVSALCKRHEDAERKICRRKTTYPVTSHELQPCTTVDAEAKIVQDLFPIRRLPTQCIFCMGQEGPSRAKRTKQFRDRDGLKRHFFRQHLQYHDPTQRIQCPHPRCRGEWLEHTNPLRNHAATVHGTLT